MGSVREFDEYDTDGNGTIDTHVFWTRVFDSQGNRTLLLEEWDYAPFGALDGRYAEIDDYDPRGNWVRHLVELNDPPQGRFDAKFLATVSYEEHAGCPRGSWRNRPDGDGLEYREVITFTTDESHHPVRMERDVVRPTCDDWEYDANGN